MIHLVKIMVTGSRTWDDDAMMIRAFTMHVPVGQPVTLYHGDNPGKDGKEGADRMAGRLWLELGLGPVMPVPANWTALGKRAGPVRNGLLVAYMPDKCLAFNLGTPGTTNAIMQARAAGIATVIYPDEERRASAPA